MDIDFSESSQTALATLPAPKLKKGTKVQYRHGRGLSTGIIIRTNRLSGMATIRTKNGSEVSRSMNRLTRA